MVKEIAQSTNYIGLENEIPKYQKKAKINISKAKSKSNHKHQNKECLLIADNIPYIASYCVICGKIRNWDVCFEKREGYYIELSKEAAFKKYKDLEQITVDDLYAKYVPANVLEGGE